MGAFCRGTGWILAALPCPYGQGTLRGCGAALPAPAGQERFVWARARFWGFRGLDGGRNAAACKLPSGARGAGGAVRIFCPSARFPVPAGLRRALPVPAQGTCPLRIPFYAAQTPQPRAPLRKPGGPYTWAVRRASLSFLSETQPRTPAPFLSGRGSTTHSRQLWQPILSAGSARTRSRDLSLENPFCCRANAAAPRSFTIAGRPLLVGRPAGFALSPIRNAT